MTTIGACARDKWQENKFDSCKTCRNYSICLKHGEEWSTENIKQTKLFEVEI